MQETAKKTKPLPLFPKYPSGGLRAVARKGAAMNPLKNAAFFLKNSQFFLKNS